MSLLLPVPTDARPRRLVQLYAGLALYGLSSALLVEARLGLDPWDVLHQGASRRSGISIGICTVIIGMIVLLLWIPLRQRPGLGTVSNAILVGLAVDASLELLSAPDHAAWQWGFLVSGVVLNGIATGMYIGAGLGPGPRDGLMTGIAARGRSLRAVRTLIELTVLVVGWLLGGTVGVGTVLYALAIGPLAHIFIPAFTVGDAGPAVPPDAHSSIA
ncbi:MAG: hypothetical protein M3198_04720 [Actinomycetota bacterium]|nr:hypothetical protein [Actinomycetota bacterium]